jgi:hypothetical protein
MRLGGVARCCAELGEHVITLSLAGAIGLAFGLGCSSGELPSAIDPPQELYAPFLAQERDIPVLDGRRDDTAWQNAPVYRVFLTNQNGGVNLPAAGVLMEWQAVWWKVIVDTTLVSPTVIDTTFASYIGFVATWLDEDKSIEPRQWTYNPTTASWLPDTQGSDWLLIFWATAADNTDLWFWDAATTNPMGYFQDMVLEGVATADGVLPLYVAIDGLNFFNDTATQRNTWDPNYDNNNTPSDSSDDRPRMAWKDDPAATPPPLPPVYSSPDENQHFLLDSTAVSLASSPYANPGAAVTVPSAVLQRPAGGSADIRAYGRHENGQWTVEFVRIAKATDDHDVVLNPTTRYFSQTLAVALGNNTSTPFASEAAPLQIDNLLNLSFEFRP